MIPTVTTQLIQYAADGFQSRNRETYDSNLILLLGMINQTCFNLVIEKLMIPTRLPLRVRVTSACRFNLVIEKLMIPTI